MPSRKASLLDPNKWDLRFFALASLVSTWSEDKSRKVGAVIVGSAHEIRSIGFNGLPRGVAGAIESRHSKEENEKYYWFEHAERNAIFNAARAGISLSECHMYSTVFPCSDCFRAVIQSGITTLSTLPPPNKDRFFKRSFEVSQEMAKEVGLRMRFFDSATVLQGL